LSVKTPFERTVFGSESDVSVKSHEKRFTIALIYPGNSTEVSHETIDAPGAGAARMRARHFFPGADILSITQVPDALPLRAAKDRPPAPSARFIRGMFRPALLADEKTLHKLLD